MRGWSLSLLLLLALIGCDRNPLPADEQRAMRLSSGADNLQVGLAWPTDSFGFREGAELARREINDRGGVLGKPLEFVIVDDSLDAGGAIPTARRVSQYFAAQPNIMTVIGHYLSDVAVPASVTYEDAGLLYLATSGFRMALTRHGFRYTFRTIPNSAFLSRQQAIFSYSQNWRRVVILETRETWAEELANGFETSALNLELEVVFRRSFFPSHRDFRGIFADLTAQRFDMIFVAGGVDASVRIIDQAREMGLDQPILVGWFIGLPTIQERLGERAESVIAPVVLNPESTDYRVQRFIETFQGVYFQPPNDDAAQGYDAVRLLAHTIETSQSEVPLTVATTLRYTTSWRGITGRHSFRRDGDIYTKMVSFAVLEDGEIDYISPSD